MSIQTCHCIVFILPPEVPSLFWKIISFHYIKKVKKNNFNQCSLVHNHTLSVEDIFKLCHNLLNCLSYIFCQRKLTISIQARRPLYCTFTCIIHKPKELPLPVPDPLSASTAGEKWPNKNCVLIILLQCTAYTDKETNQLTLILSLCLE